MQRAFSLVELLVVMVIMSILAGAVTISLSGRKQIHALKLAQKDLSVALADGLEKSRQSQLIYRMVFTNMGNTYQLQSNSEEAPVEFLPVTGRAGLNYDLPEGIALSGISDDGSVYSGLPDYLELDVENQMGSTWIRLSNSTGMSKSVVVNWQIGVVDLGE